MEPGTFSGVLAYVVITETPEGAAEGLVNIDLHGTVVR
jgi:hypothetical protein